MTFRNTGFIIAGGKSKRMGINKSFLPFDGKKLIEHSINLLRCLCDEVYIVANHPNFERFGFPVIKDNFPDLGPISGIEAALSFSKTKHNLIISCDTPLLNLNVFHKIIENVDNNNQAVIPRIGKNTVEPLVGYYSKDIVQKIKHQIENKNYKLQSLLTLIDTKFVDFENSYLFKNLNTPIDVKKEISSIKIKLPNLILIAGDKRNVGKTFLACKIIQHLSSFSEVIGIKISSHLHPQNETGNTILNTKEIKIVEEKKHTNKDSSRMLQAGAKRVFFIMAHQENISTAFDYIRKDLTGYAVVCESGGLIEYVNPALFLFVTDTKSAIRKHQYLKYSPIIVANENHKLNFDEKNIGFKNNHINIF